MPITILMADDDADDRRLTQEAFEEGRLINDVRFVENGEQLLEYLRKQGAYAPPADAPRPGLILLDLNMPRKNGAQCLSEIRNQQELQHLPVVVLSTSSSESIIDEMYHYGANLYVQKPNDVRSWKRVIAKVLNLDWNIQTPFSFKKNFMLIDF